MRQSSQEAERSRHFSQALDYALTAARINAADDDNLKAIDRLRWEESLGAALHDAQYCESIKDWSGALTALEAFERAFLQSNRPEGSQRQHHSAEYDRAQQRRAVLRAGLGDCDPLLAWTE
jgi:hypothetical protein